MKAAKALLPPETPITSLSPATLPDMRRNPCPLLRPPRPGPSSPRAGGAAGLPAPGASCRTLARAVGTLLPPLATTVRTGGSPLLSLACLRRSARSPPSRDGARLSLPKPSLPGSLSSPAGSAALLPACCCCCCCRCCRSCSGPRSWAAEEGTARALYAVRAWGRACLADRLPVAGRAEEAAPLPNRGASSTSDWATPPPGVRASSGSSSDRSSPPATKMGPASGGTGSPPAAAAALASPAPRWSPPAERAAIKDRRYERAMMQMPATRPTRIVDTAAVTAIAAGDSASCASGLPGSAAGEDDGDTVTAPFEFQTHWLVHWRT
mmetsp:Transcript_25714/g.96825  ORF Transcript_25714/g.96825 Transcript_25714/m.96825 type:complete len:323 (-) Transcript_25714:103-1071(-)